MNVKHIESKDFQYCLDDIEVIWGIKEDTICFLLGGESKCYYPISKETWNKDKDNKDKLIRSVDINNKSGDRYYLLQDSKNEKYTIRFIHNRREGTILVFITNADFGVPHYILGFGCNKCADL